MATPANANADADTPMSLPESTHKPESKRKRIRRACDDCRGRKTKCDGEQPCEACINYNQECTYSTDKKARYGGPLYVEELEKKIERLQYALVQFVPGINIKRVLASDHASQTLPTVIEPPISKHRTDRPSRSPSKDQELLDTMIRATGRLDIDGMGRCDYHGDFSGLAFLDRISDRCCQLLNRDTEKEISSKLFPPRGYSPSSVEPEMPQESSRHVELPPKTVASYLTTIAIGDACSLLRFVHKPSFDKRLERIYEIEPDNYSREDKDFMSLLYVTLALGELYAGKPTEGDDPASSDVDKAKGAKYFRAGQVLIDAMDCHDITSLQTILCMVIYFQSLGLMHCCYSYISVAIASAFRMGLHRSLVLRFFDPIEQEVRKRVFWVLQTMDTYVATMLGLPKNIRAEDFDQDLPIDIDDEFITADGITPMPEGHTSIMAVANAHTKLLLIMANVVARIYPNQKQLSRECSSYQVDYTRVVNVEAELDDWFRNVAEPPTMSVPVSPKALGLQLLLRLAYAHVQMVLYRPFIQHLVRAQPNDVPEMRSYACASACVTASMQVIWIVEQMDTHGLLIGAYWFTVYITFFAVMSLCMFILGNSGDPTAMEAMTAAVKGRQILIRLSSESASAARCVASLGVRLSIPKLQPH
ncbi:hypothetical protein IFR05_014429 [Cadophora sp. M221]|nr:hypothetical protein IFR05_014429 [Cadophora sp. M221]